MAIPKNINKEHIILAIQKIDREGFPEKRDSTRHRLSYNGNYYPPKYVISIANIYANGEEYSPSLFSGGEETNRFLNRLGFTIVDDVSSTTNEKDDEDRLPVVIPALEPVRRSREYQGYDNTIRDKVIYAYLFHARTHRWLDENIIGLDPDESRGYQSMGILHFIGLKDKHKGMFKDLTLDEAITLLEEQSSDFSLVIQSLQRNIKGDQAVPDTLREPSSDGYVDLELIADVVPEQIQITNTEKEQIIKSRVGHSTFKKNLVQIQKKCMLCGLEDDRFLIASHIKPWSESSHQERLDIKNGLLLCPNHDSLFDKGYISFDENGAIMLSSSLNETTLLFLNVNESMKITLDDQQQEYMRWHRANIFNS